MMTGTSAVRGRRCPAARAIVALLLSLSLPTAARAQSVTRFKTDWLGVSNRGKIGLTFEALGKPFTCYATSRATADRGIQVALSAYQKVLGTLPGTRQEINRKIVLCIWDDREDYHTYAALYNLSARDAFAFACRNILPGTDAVFGYVRPEFFEETLPHEIGHIILYNLLDPSSQSTPPSWLHEGFAQLAEGNLERSLEKACLSVVRAMDEGTFLPVRQLTAPRKPDALPRIFYAEALLFVRYLMQGDEGEDAFWGLCRYASRNRGKEFEHYFRNYYPQVKDIDDCENRWEESITRDLSAGAKARTEAALREMEKGAACAAAGRPDEALGHCSLAVGDLRVLLCDYGGVEQAGVDGERVRGLMASCVEHARGAGRGETTVRAALGETRREIEERFGESVAEGDGGRCVIEGGELEIDFTDEETAGEIVLTGPRAGRVAGMRVGDTLDELLVRFGVFDTAAWKVTQQLFLARARAIAPRADMDSFEDGSYPVVAANGTCAGMLIREPIDREREEWRDGDWFFTSPVDPDKGVCMFRFSGEKISKITLVPARGLVPLFESRVRDGSRRILPRDGKASLQIGGREESLTALLGEPVERNPYLVPKVSTSKKTSGGFRMKRKIDEDEDLSELEYPGLTAVTWGGRIVTLYARAPSRAALYGVRVGDSLELVTRVMGSTTDVMKFERRQRADEIRDKEKYRPLVLRYRRGNARVAFIIDDARRVRVISAHATEWKGKRWGDTFYMR